MRVCACNGSSGYLRRWNLGAEVGDACIIYEEAAVDSNLFIILYSGSKNATSNAALIALFPTHSRPSAGRRGTKFASSPGTNPPKRMLL